MDVSRYAHFVCVVIDRKAMIVFDFFAQYSVRPEIINNQPN